MWLKKTKEFLALGGQSVVGVFVNKYLNETCSLLKRTAKVYVRISAWEESFLRICVVLDPPVKLCKYALNRPRTVPYLPNSLVSSVPSLYKVL